MSNRVSLVSIIIPMYNSALYIAETIQSALAQTWENKEIIIVDDGSKDNSVAIAKSFENDNNIIVIQQQNQGAAAARNTGLKYSNGDFIQYLDADDLISPNKIADQLNAISGNKDCLAIGPTVYFKTGSIYQELPVEHEWYRKGSTDMADFLIKLYGGDWIGPGYGGMVTIHAWLSPRKLIDAAGPWNEELSVDDDGEYFCRIVLQAKTITYVDSAIAYYRKHNLSSLSNQKTIKSIQSLYKSVNLKMKHLFAVTHRTDAKKAIGRYFVEVAVSAYPRSIKIANLSLEQAKNLGVFPINNYQHTKFYKLLTKTFGWKTSAWVSYIKNKL